MPLSKKMIKKNQKGKINKNIEDAIYIIDIIIYIAIYTWSIFSVQFCIAFPTACFTACASIVSPSSSFYKNHNN